MRSRQARRNLPDPRCEESDDMFERFTDRARRVVVLAQEEARMLNHNYIGTEHILLGLIHEGEGVAAKALESLGSAWRRSGSRSRRSSARASRRRPGTSRSPPGQEGA
jgi:ATP-dependent Clp protease ATP-binding subunit ClpA